MSDVTELADDQAFDYISQQKAPVPRGLFMFTFGFCCTDLSNLNNHSSGYKQDCLDTGAGKTGKTWKGNMSFVEVDMPMIVMMENVPASLKGRNFVQMQTDLVRAGYSLAEVLQNSSESGVPQDRWRAWFVALRNDCCSPGWRSLFIGLTQALKLQQVMPLQRFILPCSHPYVEAVMKHKKERKERLDLKLAKTDVSTDDKKNKPKSKQCRKTLVGVVTKAKAKPKAKSAKKVRSGQLWQFDHWRMRLQHRLPSPAAVPDSQVVKSTAEDNGMCDRERDLMRMFMDVDVAKSTSVELKHSAPRVIRDGSARRRPGGCTSCLLPSSKIMLFPPLTEKPRFAQFVYHASPRGVVSSFDVLCAVVV